MRLGTRWAVGGEPPTAVPAQIRPTIAAVEARLAPGDDQRWTLTWLEGRPIAELEDGTVVAVTRAGGVVERHIDDPEDDED